MKDAIAARKAARKKFVAEKVASKGISAKQARQRFYVQTRMSELEKKTGKPVSAEKRKELQQKFQSGNVSREGFAAPKKKVVSKSASASSSPSASVKPASTTKSGSPSKGSPNQSSSQTIRQWETYGTNKSGSNSSAKSDKKGGRSVAGKTYDLARNEFLGVDDFGRVGKNLRKGNYGKAALSAGAGVAELGTTALMLLGIGQGIKGATTAAKAAKLAKAARGTKAIGSGTKAIGSGMKAIGPGQKAIGPGAKAAVKKSSTKKPPSVKKPPTKKPPSVKKPPAKKSATKKPATKKK